MLTLASLAGAVAAATASATKSLYLIIYVNAQVAAVVGPAPASVDLMKCGKDSLIVVNRLQAQFNNRATRQKRNKNTIEKVTAICSLYTKTGLPKVTWSDKYAPVKGKSY